VSHFFRPMVRPVRRPPAHAVVFDMDGTLIDSTGCVTGAYRATVAALGGPDCTAEEVVAAYPIGPPRAILAHLLGRPATMADELAYLDALAASQDEVAVYPGIEALLDGLAEAGVPTAVFTGASQAAARGLLGAVGLLDRFGHVVGGDMVARPKPRPDGVLRACALLGVSPEAAAYVGDAPIDLEAAARAGALAVAAGWGHQFDPAAPGDVVAWQPGDVLALAQGARA
jgi:HAD superfamily hydrolase (TIGR01509 family)